MGQATEKVVDDSRGGTLPAGPGAAPAAGHSGEGSRSAMEQWMRQEQRREAQRPREAGAPPERGPAS